MDEDTAGVLFYRCDLHIHSYGASHDVEDALMTPEAIVGRAASEGLSVIAIPDHNEISNVRSAITAATTTQQVTAVPGVELSTPQGHLLVYFKEFDDLQRYFGSLDLRDRGTEKSRCADSMSVCLQRIDPSLGFGILAH
ncbi:MAG: PHP domain-containing protein, partial [Myxococcota bacterium]